MDFDRSFIGYFDDKMEKMPLFLLRNIGTIILYVGLFAYMMGIDLSQGKMLSLMSLLNFVLYVPSLWMPFYRFGPDYTAYIA